MADLVTEAEVTAAWAGFADLAANERAALIAAASTAVEDHCGRTFASAATTESLDGPGLSRVWLSRRPVVSILSVTVNGETLGADDYDFDPATGELYRGDGRTDPRHVQGFPRGRRNVTVVYTAGYATVPAPVKRATILVAKTLADQTQFTQTLQTEQLGDYRAVLNTTVQRAELPMSAVALLAPYVQDDVA
jgi:hypothetical protein